MGRKQLLDVDVALWVVYIHFNHCIEKLIWGSQPQNI